MRISDWSSDVCSSDLGDAEHVRQRLLFHGPQRRLHQRLILGSLHIAIPHMLHRAGEKSARAARGIEDDFAGLGIDAIHHEGGDGARRVIFTRVASGLQVVEELPVNVTEMLALRSEEQTSELPSLMRI